MKPFLYVLAFFRMILVFLGMVGFMLAYTLKSIYVKHTKSRALKLREDYLKYWALPILNIHVTVKGAPVASTALYVANHRSFSDPLVICKYLRAFVIAKAEVADYPIINKGAQLTGVIWIKREDKNSREATRSTLVHTIQEGYNMLVFPEGTVGKLAATLPFRKGTFQEAAKHDILVVPIVIEYKSAKDLWIHPHFIKHYFAQFNKWKTEVKISFGDPITSNDGLLLAQKAEQWINEEKINLRKDWSTVFDDGKTY